ncbi:MAG: hypothetical protein LBQ51_07165 [Desulfovibrio sp.]|jgi:succinyl-CoA synthetase alpha subunit|nr:hypothetical protein [Desulfovibrio sp.]
METAAVLLIGEIGGSAEEQAAAYLASVDYRKPVLAYIAGAGAPAAKKMGHAGAIIDGNRGSVASKRAALLEAGVYVAATLEDIYLQVEKLLRHRGALP